MLIDIHAHIWQGHYNENKEEIMKACELYEISKVYISGLNTYFPDETEISELNQEVHKFMHEQPDKIGGFCYVNPINKNCLDVLKKGIDEFGMSGMKLWVATFCDDPIVYPLVEKCIDYRIPILIHAFHKAFDQLPYETLGENVGRLAEKYPESKLIMAHLGANCYNGIKPIQKYTNVSADISGSIFRRDDVDYAVKHLGAERVLFGTDMIGSFLVSYGQIMEADLSEAQKDLIYYKNALKLLDRS